MFSARQLKWAAGVFVEVAEKLVRVLENELVRSQQRPGSSQDDDSASDEATNEGDTKDPNRNRTQGVTVADAAWESGQASTALEGTLDMSEWTSRVSLEAAGRAILGYSFDPLDSRVANVYTRAVKELIPTLFSLALIRNFAPFLVKLGPPAFRRWVVERVPSRRVRKVVESSDVMHESARGILDERRVALLSSSRSPSNTATIPGNTSSDSAHEDDDDDSKPKDIITTLLHANTSLCAEEDRMSDAELTGQMTVLIFGAQDTTAGALARVFWLLSRDGEVQRRVREEIKRAWEEKEEGRSHHLGTNNNNNNEDGLGEGEKRLDVDVVMGLPWLDAVVKETLRVYPPVPFVRRVCTKATAIPYTPSPTPPPASPDATSVSPTATTATPGDSQETRDVELLYIPEGTKLFLSVVGCNRSKEVWGADAGVWRPERWLSAVDGVTESNREDEGEGKGKGTTKKPYSDHVKIPGAWNGMLTFLGGGRSCVGSRFAIMEMKIVLATVLSKMYFKPTGDEIVWNLSQIISPSVVRRRRKSSNGGEELEGVEEKGLPLVAVLDDLTV